jgi:hypothetical protein
MMTLLVSCHVLNRVPMKNKDWEKTFVILLTHMGLFGKG